MRLPAQLLARYADLDRLGEGGMGTVYKATDRKLGRSVAIKIIKPELAGTEIFHSTFQRFRREGKVLSSLSHPSIVRLFDFDEHEGVPYIVMEFVEGPTLKPLINEGGLPPERAVSLVEQLADALSVVHEKGVLHRDVKPTNVLLVKGDQPKLVDFGLSHFLVEAGEGNVTRLTRTGQLLGTPRYVPPEVLAGASSSVSGDIYGLGVVFYQLLTGHHYLPYDNLTDFLTWASFGQAFKIPPPGVDHRIDGLVVGMLQRNPQERVPSMELVRDGCRDWLSGRAHLSGTRGSSTSGEAGETLALVIPEADGASMGRLRKVLLGLCATAIIVAVAVLCGLFGGPDVAWRRSIRIEAAVQRAKVSWHTSRAGRFDYRLLTARTRKLVTSGAEAAALRRHTIRLKDLEPKTAYHLLLRSQGVSSVVTFATGVARLKNGVLVAPYRSCVWADFQTNLDDGPSFQVRSGSTVKERACQGGRGPVLLRGLPYGQGQSFSWKLRVGSRILAQGRSRPTFKAWTNPGGLHQRKWDPKPMLPTPMTDIVWVGERFAYGDWSGALHCFEIVRHGMGKSFGDGPYRHAWSFELAGQSALPLEERRICLAALPGGRLLFGSRRADRRFTCVRLDPILRSEAFRKRAGSDPLERLPVWMTRKGDPWQAPLGSTEWFVTLKAQPFEIEWMGRGLSRGREVFFRDCGPYGNGWRSFDLARRRLGRVGILMALPAPKGSRGREPNPLQWFAERSLEPLMGLPVRLEGLADPKRWESRSLFFLDGRPCLLLRRLARSGGKPTSWALTIWPATGDRRKPFLRLRFRNWERNLRLPAKVEAPSLWLVGLRKLYEIRPSSRKAPVTAHALASLLPKGDRAGYFSGPALVIDGRVHFIRHEPPVGVSGFAENLLGNTFGVHGYLYTYDPSTRALMRHEPALVTDESNHRGNGVRSIDRRGPYLTGYSARNLFAVDLRSMVAAHWTLPAIEESFRRASIHPAGFAAMADSVGRVWFLPLPALLYADGRKLSPALVR